MSDARESFYRRVLHCLDRIHDLGFKDVYYDVPLQQFLVPSRNRYITLEAAEDMPRDDILKKCLETDDR